MTRNRNDEIRGRLETRLRSLGKYGEQHYAWLADQTGESRQQVRKWVSGETDRFPAAFAAAMEEVGIVSAGWLLTGDGSAEPTAQSVVADAFGEIAAIVDRVRATPAAPKTTRTQSSNVVKGGKRKGEKGRKRGP